MEKLSPAMIRALKNAAARPRGNVCPIAFCHAAAEQALIDALERRGLIDYEGPVPFITPAGRNAAEFL